MSRAPLRRPTDADRDKRGATRPNDAGAALAPAPRRAPPASDISALVHAATVAAKEMETLPDPRAEEGRHDGGRWLASLLPVADDGRYHVGGEVAQGGIGRVLRAHDARLGRPVALKQLLGAGDAAERRFVREALVTARLQHPSIIPIYDAGRWPTGEPFYAMKLVSGRSFEDVIAEARTLEQRGGLLRHVLAAAEAVAFAHSQRIIHRDLKPANILVGDFGETVVIDWGLAKDLAGDGDADADAEPEPAAGGARRAAGLTLEGAVMGTPAYMPPEQAQGHAVDERADVYALGAILYHALAGVAPYEGRTAREILRAVAAGPPLPLGSRQRDLSDELLAIVNKAMGRDPAERYPSARELAEDLRRFEAGQIVAAHRYSPLDMLRRFFRRYKAPLAVAAAALVALLLVGAISVRRIIAERVRAEQKQAEAEAARREAVERADDLTIVQARASLEHDPNGALAWLKALSPSFPRWPAARIIAADADARGLGRVLRGHTSIISSAIFSPDGRSVASVSDDRTVRIWDVATGASRTLTGHTDEVWSVTFSADGRTLATGSKDSTVRLWDLATGESRRLDHHTWGVYTLVFSTDGRRLLSVGGGVIVSWDLATGEPRVLSDRVGPSQVTFSTDGGLVARRTGRELSLQDTVTGERRTLADDLAEGERREGGRGALRFSPDGKVLAEQGHDGVLRRWDVATGEGRVLGRGGATALTAGLAPERRLAFSPDGARLAAISEASTVRVWDVDSGASLLLRGHEGGIMRVVFSHDGKHIATGGFDKAVRLWDADTGEGRVLYGNEDVVLSLAFSPDDTLLATAGADHTVRIFRVTAGASRVLAEHGADAALSGFSPDGQLLASGSHDGAVHIHDVAGSSPPITLDAHDGAASVVRFSPRGELLATAGRDGRVCLWTRAGRAVWASSPPERQEITSLAFTPDGRLVAATAVNGAVRLLDVDSGAERTLTGHRAPALAVASSPHGDFLASADAEGVVRLWRVELGDSTELRGHKAPVEALAFSPDGKTLVSGGRDHRLRFWDVATGESKVADASGGGVFQVAFSPDGASLFSAGEVDSGVRVWDVATATQRRFLRGHAGSLSHFSLSPDGGRLVTASTDGTARLWDPGTGESRALRGHAGAVLRVAFSPDGKLIASASADGALRLWTDDLPDDPAGLRAFIEAATQDLAPR